MTMVESTASVATAVMVVATVVAAVSGGQEGTNVTITVTYGGVSQTGFALSPGVGNTTDVNFDFTSNATSQAVVTS